MMEARMKKISQESKVLNTLFFLYISFSECRYVWITSTQFIPNN